MCYSVELIQPATRASLQEADLWERYRDRVYRYLLRLTGEPETAADLTQETFLQAVRDLRRNPQPAHQAAAWVMRIANNRAMDLFRRRRLIRWLPFLPERHGGTVGDETDQVVTRDLVKTALRRLPPETAAILLLRDGEGFSNRELAGMLGLGEAAVRKRLSRAREAFRSEYQRLRG